VESIALFLLAAFLLALQMLQTFSVDEVHTVNYGFASLSMFRTNTG